MSSITEGFHVPATPFVDVDGNAGAGVPGHKIMDVPKLNAGVRIGFTLTVKMVVVAH